MAGPLTEFEEVTIAEAFSLGIPTRRICDSLERNPKTVRDFIKSRTPELTQPDKEDIYTRVFERYVQGSTGENHSSPELMSIINKYLDMGDIVQFLEGAIAVREASRAVKVKDASSIPELKLIWAVYGEQYVSGYERFVESNKSWGAVGFAPLLKNYCSAIVRGNVPLPTTKQEFKNSLALHVKEVMILHGIAPEFPQYKVEFLHQVIDTVLFTLTEKERKVIQMRFGLGGYTQMTLEECRVPFKVTRERVRQTESRALRKLKHPSRGRALRSVVLKVMSEQEFKEMQDDFKFTKLFLSSQAPGIFSDLSSEIVEKFRGLCGENCSAWDIISHSEPSRILSSKRLEQWVEAMTAYDPSNKTKFVHYVPTVVEASVPDNLLVSIRELDFPSVRTGNSLWWDDIRIVGKLVQKTEAGLLRVPNFGRKSLNEVKNKLATMGLHLGMILDPEIAQKVESFKVD